MKTFLTVCGITFTLLTTIPTFAGQAEIDQIEQAAGVLDVKTLHQLSQQTHDYDQALAYYRLALSLNLKGQSSEASDALDKAMSVLETLDQTKPDDVEIKTLLSQVYGYKIAIAPMKGIYYGPKAGDKLAEAEALAPNNPRVHLIKGIAKYNTPAMFGGSIKAASDAFDQALVAFEQDQYSNYHWGHAETYTWRGLIKLQNGEVDAAKKDWQLALNLKPDYGWAKMLIDQN